MAKIFTKLNIGDTVATSGTRVFKKLTTEQVTPEPPIWNGTDLTGTTWYLRDDWTAEAGYGVFDVAGAFYLTIWETYVADFEHLYVGYHNIGEGGVTVAPYAYHNSLIGGDAYPYHGIGAPVSFSGGTDTTNPRLINWMLENGRLTSHRLQPGLYDANNNLVASWDELVNTYGMSTLYVTPTDANSASYIFANNNELSSGTKLIIDASIWESIGFVQPGNRRGAFAECANLTSVIIPDGVSFIAPEMFRGCTNLTSIINHNGTKVIYDNAFADCSSLKLVTIPDVTEIEFGAFKNCTSLTEFTIPDSVTVVNAGAFGGCSSLTSITIPDGVTAIYLSAFVDCVSLMSIIIPDSLTSIANSAFYGCKSLTDVYYQGTESQWKAITIGTNNDELLNATIHYNSQ